MTTSRIWQRQKLLRLVGNDFLDDFCLQYDRLYACLLRILYTIAKEGNPEWAIPAIVMSLPDPDSSYFILSSPGMKRRLADLAFLEVKSSLSVTMFGNPFFTNVGFTERIVKWAMITLKQVDQLLVTSQEVKPETFSSNPLLVWGAAVMDGFFTEDEMPAAVSYIREQFGDLTAHPECLTWITQAELFANLHAQLLPKNSIFGFNPVKRFGQFCAKAGFIFPIHDREGNLVSYSAWL